MSKTLDIDDATDVVQFECGEWTGLANEITKQFNQMSPTQDSCEYCHEDSDGYVKPIDKNSHAFVRFGLDGWELSLKANGWHGEARIKFCPMCGRRLADD